MNGIVLTSRRLVVRLMNFVERRFGDAEECVNQGGGVHETRDEYRWKCRHVLVRLHPDGTRAALVLDAGARTRLAAAKTAIQAKITAGTASELEAALFNLPVETVLDATWDATPTVP